MALGFAVFGLIIGSFLNVLILRWEKRSLGGRSSCTSCDRTLEWYELVPMLSWLALRGRCRTCGSFISAQYPLVEGATAIIFGLIGAAPIPLLLQVLALPIAALLIAIAVYDLYHTIIPDVWVYISAVIALFAALISITEGMTLIEVLLAGPAAAAPLFILWLISRGAWMGLGDVKLALTIGWLLGMWIGVVAVFFAFVIGALVSVPLLFLGSPAGKRLFAVFTPRTTSANGAPRFTMKSEIPFGPFLIASCFLLWFMQMYGIEIPLALW